MPPELHRAILLAVLRRLPEPLLWALCGGRRTEQGGRRLDLRTQLFLKVGAWLGGADYSDKTVAQARADLRRLAMLLRREPPRAMPVEDRTLSWAEGSVPGRIYRGSRGLGLPVLLYFHGGGWVVGDLDTHDDLCRTLAAQVRCLLVAVDYRLAPEHPFPAAVDDALGAFCWVCANAGALGGDAHRIAVVGDSAGGNLAAVVSQLARAKGRPGPAAQVLFYPVTDLAAEAPSYELFARGFGLSRDAMRWFRGHYLPAEGLADDPRASPLRAPDLSGLPPALIITAGFDPLRDEGRAYAEGLRRAGTPVTYRCYDDLIHGFLKAHGVQRRAGQAVDEAVAFLRQHLEA